jgi:DNA-binding HxlR family transcriptional regulator
MAKSSKPIMVLLDLLGRRWVLRIVWELRSGEALGFRELQRRCGDLSPSVLSQRLGELKKAAIVRTDDDGDYALTTDGARLLKALKPLNEWAEHWRSATTKK